MAYGKKWEGEWLADEECNSLTNNPHGICDACRPSDYEENGGHAMVVIAYDDDKFGGSFQILNSWGSDWGDDGKVWVPYRDLLNILKEYNPLIRKRNLFFLKMTRNQNKKKN